MQENYSKYIENWFYSKKNFFWFFFNIAQPLYPQFSLRLFGIKKLNSKTDEHLFIKDFNDFYNSIRYSRLCPKMLNWIISIT